MQTVIIVIHLMIVLVMIGAVLLQKSEGGGLGMGGGAGFMSSRGTANLLTNDGGSGGGIFRHQPAAVMDRGLQSPAGLDHRRAHVAIAAGRWSGTDRTANLWRHSGFAEEGRRAATAESTGSLGPAGAALAIKQRGHAGRRLASCIRNPHQDIDNTLNSTSPTVTQNVCCGLRFVLANRPRSLKG